MSELHDPVVYRCNASTPKTIDEVIAHLRGQGFALAAVLIEILRENERSSRRSAETLLRQYYDLKEKYEPQSCRREPATRYWTGD